MTPTTTAAGQLSAWSSATLRTGVPAEVAEAFKPHILDLLGCALGAWRKDAAREAARIAEPTAGRHGASIIGRGEVFSAEDAAFANAALSHGLDYDDTHALSVTHATAVVVPAALAVAEAFDRSGRDALVAAVAGVETVCRLGAAARNQFHLRGFHPTSVCGVFGAALASALLLNAGEAEIASALGLAGSFASGLFAYLEGGGNPKPFHVAHASRDGIAAAKLAKAGATGPLSVIEGRFGLFDAFLGSRKVNFAEQLASLGQVWESTRMSIKPYPACHSMHACLDAAVALQAEHRFGVSDVAGIEAVVAGAREVALVLEPLAAKRRPQTATAARFSLPFSLAYILIKGNIDLDTADVENLADPEIIALAELVTYRVESLATAASALPGAVEIRLRSGERIQRTVHVERGGPDNPLAGSAIISKYRDNVGEALTPGDRDSLCDAVLRIEAEGRLPAIAEIFRRVGTV